MNRRSLLRILAGALILDPERMLWVPREKLISIPSPRYRGLGTLMGQDRAPMPPADEVWLVCNRARYLAAV
jgi:hypothetical protein